MHHGAVIIAVTLALFARDVTSFPRSAPRSHNRLSCDRTSFEALLPKRATLEKVAAVPEGGSYGEGAANLAYPTDATNLPVLCAVTVRVKSSKTSSYRFGLFLPDRWESRLLVVGNVGGFAGGINWLDMAVGPRHGMAGLSTDTGHNSSWGDGSWARNQPEKKTDWGWRAIHGSTVLGKKLVRAYYGSSSSSSTLRSYFSGCSNGGRQGLKELQLFPDTFDGALIGAPGWWTSHINNDVTQLGIWSLPVSDPKHLSAADLALLGAEVVRQCDGADGVLDGIVSAPETCDFNDTVLLCPGNNPNPPPCLTAAQLHTSRLVHADWRSPTTNRLLYPGYPLSTENSLSLLLDLGLIGGEPAGFGLGYDQYFLYDDLPDWDWRTDFNESAVELADRTNPGGATADDYAALGKVAKRGGKVLMYQGLADGIVSAKGTELYYERTVDALGWKVTEGFMGMFLVPGMEHCAGTLPGVNAPWYFAGAEQQTSVDAGKVVGLEGNPEYDVLQALVEWVEEGKEVERVVATTWNNPMDPGSGVKRQRPICKWPKRAVWDGKGDLDDKGSWRCNK